MKKLSLFTLFLLSCLFISAAHVEIDKHQVVLHFADLTTGHKAPFTIFSSIGRYGTLSEQGKTHDDFWRWRVDEKTARHLYFTIIDAEGKRVGQLAHDIDLFGDETYVFCPSEPMTRIHDVVDSIHTQMFSDDFGRGRYAILFQPGDYRKAGLLKVPFYEHMAGLGKTPYEVKLNNIHTPPHLPNNNGTCTFWRSLENVSVIGRESYEEDSMFKWSVSQAAPIRRVYSERTVKHQWLSGWVSGGFTADCYYVAPAGSHGQQQWYTRNSYLGQGRGTFREGSFNFMFQGVELGERANAKTYVNNWDKGGNVTFLPTTPVIREKPFLFLGDDGKYKVFRPALRRDAKGVSYTRESIGEGDVIDLEENFFIVRPGVPAKEINQQLFAGKHILFQPGFFELDEPLRVTKPETIVMGLGWSTLVPSENNPLSALVVDDVDGVTICSLLFDAHHTSRTLLYIWGKQNRHAENPTLLADLFFRIGGFVSAPVHVECAVEVESNDVIADHFWIWRADHGVHGSVGWDVNTARNGLHVLGDDFTIYGLFNEHFQEYQTLWEGERGRMYFYQCETPYDAYYQARYMSEDGTRPGYAAYKVADHVKQHDAYALGIYDVFFKTDIRIYNSVEIPEHSGVTIHHLCNVSLSEPGDRGFDFLINGKGKSTFNTFRVCRPNLNIYQGGAEHKEEDFRAY